MATKTTKRERAEISYQYRTVQNLYGSMSRHYQQAEFYKRVLAVNNAITWRQFLEMWSAFSATKTLDVAA